VAFIAGEESAILTDILIKFRKAWLIALVEREFLHKAVARSMRVDSFTHLA
jgi:hypothetical protein